MPFCTKCGTQVREQDAYCPQCGVVQRAGSAPATGPVFHNFSPRAAAVLCYLPVVGWIACVIVFASHRFREDATIRFHAFQGLYIFVAWLLAEWFVGPLAVFSAHEGSVRGIFGLHAIAGLLKALLLAVWIFMIVKTSQGEDYRLPIFGELADKSVASRSGA